MEGTTFGKGQGGSGDEGNDSVNANGTGSVTGKPDNAFADPGDFELPAGRINLSIPPDSEGSGGSGTADDFLTGIDTNASEPKRRGRRSRAEIDAAGGTTTTRKSKASRVDIDVLKWTLLSIHTMLHAATDVPELEMSEEEAAKLAECSSRVMEFYTGVVSEKSQAWMALLMAIGGVYGSRAVAYYLRTRHEAEASLQARREAASRDPTQTPFHNLG